MADDEDTRLAAGAGVFWAQVRRPTGKQFNVYTLAVQLIVSRLT